MEPRHINDFSQVLGAFGMGTVAVLLPIVLVVIAVLLARATGKRKNASR